jgi:hypothetical protein
MPACVASNSNVQEWKTQSPRPLAAIAMPGNGITVGLLPSDAGMEMGETRGGSDWGNGVGDAGFAAGTWGPVLTSVIRVSARRLANFHSPHQSSSRTWGQTPSIMYDLALMGCNMGASRRHCPHCVTLPSLGLTFCRS